MLRSLRARLILLVCVAFVPMLAITARNLVRERDALLQRAYDIAARRVETALAAQRDLIADGRRYLGAVALLPPVSSGDSETCGRTVERVRTLLDEGWTFERIGTDGRADCSARQGASDIVPVSVARSTPSAGGALRIAAYGYDRSARLPVVTLQMPLPDSLAVAPRRLSITMQLAWIAPLVAEVTSDSQAIVALLDRDQRVIARYPAVDARTAEQFPLALADSNGVAEANGTDGVRRLWIHRELPSPNGIPVFIAVGIPATPVYAMANRQVLQSLVIITVIAMLAVLAAWWAAERFFLRDVRALLDATESIGRGDMSARTGLTERSGELGQLADAFDGMAARLQDRQDRLAHAQKMESVGQLAGGVAHDFNNLLTAIVANAESARESLPSDHAAQVELQQVLYAAQRSAQLTRQLLAFARQHTLATRVLTLDRLLGNVTVLLERLIGEHIQVTVDTDPELRLTRVDPAQIEQAIINLAVNARDAMPAGGTLAISVRNLTLMPTRTATEDVDPPGDWVAITVSDTGTGMTADVLRHAFDPFFTTKPVGEGTGLGLAMVYGTAHQHGGHVHITSTLGQGTTVRMLLPVEMHADPSNETPAFGVSAAGTGRGDETIMLVEDEAAVRAVSARLLRSRGYEVIEAPDGEAALAMLEGDRLDAIDLVVTDLVMPKIGGADMVDALRQRRPLLPVLIVSGYSATGVSNDLLAAPGTAFLEKPFNARSLLGAVRSLLSEAPSNVA